MLQNDALRALREDDLPQRIAQDKVIAAAAAWRARPEVARVADDLAAFATQARDFAECDALRALFDVGDAARSYVDGLAATMVGQLAATPLAHVPFRHFTDGTVSTLLLERAGAATLTLVALDPVGLRARPAPSSVGFGPQHCWEHVLAGSGRAELVDLRDVAPRSATLRRRDIALHPGRVIARDAGRTALLVRETEGCLVTLRLQRRKLPAPPSRQYDLASGALLHQAAGSPRESRHELMLALLGRMERRDAAPLVARIATGAASQALRWQALREGLALDTLAGFTALSQVATDAVDPLAVPAGALRAQLIEAHPQLAEVVPCPA